MTVMRVAAAAALLAATVPLTGADAAAPAAAGKPARVVVAVIEPHINVYHREFRDSGRVGHPSQDLPGYPRSAQPLRLALDERSVEAAVDKDAETWAGLRPGELYYIPGTKFTGLVHLPSPLDTADNIDIRYPPRKRSPLPVVDGYTYHGTGVASVLAGAQHGTCPRCDVVVVAADNPEDGLRWAAAQPWIDIVSNSWGGPLGVPTQATEGHPERAAELDASRGSRLAAASGKAVVFGSGNGATGLGGITPGTQHSLTWASPYAGPPCVPRT